MRGRDRRLFGEGSGQMDQEGRRSVGPECVTVGLSDPILEKPSSCFGTYGSSGLRSPFHQGEGLEARSPQSNLQGSSGTGSPFSGFLQPPFCRPESLGSMEASDRSFSSEQVCSKETNLLLASKLPRLSGRRIGGCKNPEKGEPVPLLPWRSSCALPAIKPSP